MLNRAEVRAGETRDQLAEAKVKTRKIEDDLREYRRRAGFPSVQPSKRADSVHSHYTGRSHSRQDEEGPEEDGEPKLPPPRERPEPKVETSQRSAKFPDPPLLSDGISPEFHIWKEKVEEKLLINEDWFPTGPRQAAYIKSRLEGKAESYLYAYLDAMEAEGNAVSPNQIISHLERLFDDPNQKTKARQEFRDLKMKYLGDIAEF